MQTIGHNAGIGSPHRTGVEPARPRVDLSTLAFVVATATAGAVPLLSGFDPIAWIVPYGCWFAAIVAVHAASFGMSERIATWSRLALGPALLAVGLATVPSAQDGDWLRYEVRIALGLGLFAFAALGRGTIAFVALEARHPSRALLGIVTLATVASASIAPSIAQDAREGAARATVATLAAGLAGAVLLALRIGPTTRKRRAVPRAPGRAALGIFVAILALLGGVMVGGS